MQKQIVNLTKHIVMEIAQQPSIFAQMVDKLRDKSEAELKLLYTQLFANDLAEEWKNSTQETGFKNATEEDIIKAIQKNRYQGQHALDDN